MPSHEESWGAAPSPKDRVDAYYQRLYTEVHGARTLGFAHSVMHRALERGRSRERHPVTLELGAGHLEHYPFVGHERDLYFATDIRTPRGSLYERVANGDGPPDLAVGLADAMSLPFESASVDRVVAGCLLIHLPDPYSAFVEWQRVLKPSGVLDVLVPCDPGLASRAFRRIVSRRAVRQQGVDPGEYTFVNAYEHVSPFNRVLTLAGAAVQPGRTLGVSYHPLAPIHSWNLNAFAILSVGAMVRSPHETTDAKDVTQGSCWRGGFSIRLPSTRHLRQPR